MHRNSVKTATIVYATCCMHNTVFDVLFVQVPLGWEDFFCDKCKAGRIVEVIDLSNNLLS
jgi:hypothetical protein